MSGPNLIYLNPDEWNPGLDYCPFMVNSDRCIGSCSTLDDQSNVIFVPSKTECLNLSVFNIIMIINDWKQEQNIFYANVNVNLMVENVIQVKIGITINTIKGPKIRENIKYGKKLYLEF